MDKTERLKKVDDLLDENKFAEALPLVMNGSSPTTSNDEAQNMFLWLANKWLQEGEYELALRLILGERQFHVKSKLTKLVWDILPKTSELMVIGGGSLGKTMTAAGWMFADYLRDPNWTRVKVLSSTQTHAKRNIFATLKGFFNHSRLPIDTKITATFIGSEDERSGIQLDAVPTGETGKGRLRGHHPIPRKNTHPVFGTHSRIRILMDEFEEIPAGVWEDVDNIQGSKFGVEHIKIVGGTNPKDRASLALQRCAPIEGWESLDPETAVYWKSKLGADVIRLDGAKCENVVERQLIYPGMLTWEGYERYLIDAGDNSPSFWTMCRGFPPPQGLHMNIIPPNFVQQARGEFLFESKTIFCASVDIAFGGGDKAIMTVGRWGKVTGWKQGSKVVTFDKVRYGLQIDKQFELKKGDSVDMANEIMRVCKNMHITPEFLAVDRTGVGTGVDDILKKMYGPEVLGLHYGEGATELHVMEDDSRKACDIYDKVVTELFFSMRKFMEFDYVKFSPGLDLTILGPELTGRKFRQAGGEKMKVESKDEYKARGFKSPDFADSACLLIHLCRMRAEFTPAMIDAPAQIMHTNLVKPSQYDKIDFYDFSK